LYNGRSFHWPSIATADTPDKAPSRTAFGPSLWNEGVPFSLASALRLGSFQMRFPHIVCPSTQTRFGRPRPRDLRSPSVRLPGETPRRRRSDLHRHTLLSRRFGTPRSSLNWPRVSDLRYHERTACTGRRFGKESPRIPRAAVHWSRHARQSE